MTAPCKERRTSVAVNLKGSITRAAESRKTVENVLLILSSLLKTAKAWGYTCYDLRLAVLTLPRDGVRTEPRFTDDEVRKIIANSSEPLSTIVTVTAVLGLRIGETLALRCSDDPFAEDERHARSLCFQLVIRPYVFRTLYRLTGHLAASSLLRFLVSDTDVCNSSPYSFTCANGICENNCKSTIRHSRRSN